MIEKEETQKRKKCSSIIKFFALIGMSTTFFSLLSLCAVAYMWFADPFGIRALATEAGFGNGVDIIQTLTSGEAPAFDSIPEFVGEDGNMVIPEEFQSLLNLAGIDTDKLAEQDPVALEACATAVVGEERAEALATGAVSPSLTDFLALKKCL